MAETEKITINLSVVDLGKIDLLVEEGFYSNRTDLIRTAVRRQLDMHADVVEASTVRKAMAVGVMGFGRSGLERRLEAGEMIDVRVLGMVVLNRDITPELALATISSIKVLGVFEASSDVKAALAEAGRILT